MASLSSRWSKPQKTGISERLNNVIKPRGALNHALKQPLKNYKLKLQN